MTLFSPSARKHVYMCIKEILWSQGDTECVKHTTKILGKSTPHLAVQVTVRYIVFYYIVILKCMNDFYFSFVNSLLYIISALNAKR